MEDVLRVGVISSTHGLKGEVKVFPTTDDPSRFMNLQTCLLFDGKNYLDLTLERVRFFKQFVIVKFKDIDDISQIEKYKGKDLFVTRENAVPLEDDEVFVADLIGLKVVTDKEEFLGTLTDVLQTGSNDVYVVRSDGGKEILLPAIKECILDVNLENKSVKIHLLPGLLDL